MFTVYGIEHGDRMRHFAYIDNPSHPRTELSEKDFGLLSVFELLRGDSLQILYFWLLLTSDAIDEDHIWGGCVFDLMLYVMQQHEQFTQTAEFEVFEFEAVEIWQVTQSLLDFGQQGR